MPENVISASLRQSIEALALEAALRGFSASEQMRPFAPALAQMRRAAEDCAHSAIAGIAFELETASSEQELSDGITRIQKLALGGTPAPAALSEDPELIADFILESREHLAAVEIQLLALERDPLNASAIDAIFRGFHTIKGLSGFLDFGAIQRFTHEVETLLELARNASIPIDSALIDIILQSSDYVSHCLRSAQAGAESPAADERLLERIRKATACPTAGLEQLRRAVPDGPQPAPVGPRTVKVDTAKLDFLVDIVGELAIAQSLVCHDPEMAAAASQRLTRKLNQLTRITADVQRIAMAMRMIPIGHLFQRMSRLVRDLARKGGKQVNIELRGEDTELDRHMVEELADPLMHMLRNAVDHGSEPPGERTAAGKSSTARLGLKARHQGGFVHIEVSDDGRGLLREKILAAARQRGLVVGGDHLPDRDVFTFIFEPGFSTAAKVTDVSGRGVGMDVVRRQIAKLRGRIDISSIAGQGTTFHIKLPLTLAIIEGLVVGVGKERYVVPMFAVKEMLRPGPQSLSSVPGGGEMALVRGSLLPIVRLHSRFGVIPATQDPASGILLVLESELKTFCLLVDELIGKQEIVIKNLGETFKNVRGVAGGCILGDGRVGLILDVEALPGNLSGQ